MPADADSEPQVWPMRAAAAGPFIILVAAAIYLQANWSRIPARFPIHWSASGVANGWGTRSFLGVYGFLLIAASVGVLCSLLAWSTLHFAPHDTAHARQQSHLTAWVAIAVGYLLAVVFALVSLLPFRHKLAAPTPWLAALVPLIVAAIGIAAWRATPPRTPATELAPAQTVDRDNGNYWYFGFYRNPNDPAILVPKRYGLGYTFNLGNTGGRWLGTATVVLIAASVLIAIAAAH
ncbi:MAG: DUF5808 domain-containing protein [Terriglobales bacterium]